MQQKKTHKRLFYQITLLVLLIAAILLLFYLAPILVTPENLAADDFGHFWAAGKLTLAGQNPYDPRAILEVLYQVGRLPDNSSIVSVMLNPPWTLPIVMLFGMISYYVSRLLWLLIGIMVIMVSTTILWSIYQGPKHSQWLAWLLAFTFTPTVSTLQKGQFTPLILLGFTGFLLVDDKLNRQDSQRFTKWQSIIIAGISISLMAIKPQLLYLIWLALLLWCWHQRKWMILIAGCVLLAIEIAIPSVFNPSTIRQYLQNIAEYPITEWATPTIGSYLRVLFGLEKFWLQFLPTLLASIWFIYYWFHHRKNWSWTDEMPLLTIVSLVTNPYSWTYDLVLLLPVIVYVAAGMVVQAHPLKNNKVFIIVILLYVILDILNILLHTQFNEFWFGWFAPGIFLLFIFYKTKIGLQTKRSFFNNF
jgi:hypothetical protein